MRITGLATAACLAVYVSGAAVFRYATGSPSRKRQGRILDDFGLIDSDTLVYLPTTSTTVLLTPLTPHVGTTTTKALFPGLEDVLFPPNGPIVTGSSVSPTLSSTSSSSTASRTHTSSSSTKSVAVLPTLSDTLTVPSSMRPTVPDMTPWEPTASPSSTSSAAPVSATSANSTWRTVGIAISVVTLIGLTILLVVFFEQWTAFVKDVFLCRRSRRDQDPLGDEEFLPDKCYESYDTAIRTRDRKWVREIRESARLSNIRYPTDVFFGDGSTLGPGKAGIGAGGGAGKRGAEVGEFGQLGRPSRPSFLQRLSMLSLRATSPRMSMKGHSPGIGNTGDGFTASTLSPPKISAY